MVVGSPLVLGIPAGGTLVAPVPLPGAGAVELVFEPGVTGNGWVPPAEPKPADGELVPLPAIGVGAAGVETLVALVAPGTGVAPAVAGRVPAGAVVALGPGEMKVGAGTGVLVKDGLPLEVATGGVLVGPIGGVDVAMFDGIGVGL